MKSEGLAVFVALGVLGTSLVGCSWFKGKQNFIDQLLQSEEELNKEALLLTSNAEDFFSDLISPPSTNIHPTGYMGRPLTIVRESDGVTVLTPLSGYKPDNTPSINGFRGLVIKCPSRGSCYANLGILQKNDQGGYSMTWYGSWEEATGGRKREETQATVNISYDPYFQGVAQRPILSYNRVGLFGFWADVLIHWPEIGVHAVFPLPKAIASQPVERRFQDSIFFRNVYNLMNFTKKSFEVEDSPVYLRREKISLIFFPKKDGNFDQAQSLEELFAGKTYIDLGVAIYREVTQGELNKEILPQIIELRLIKEGEAYAIVGRKLRGPNTSVNFSVDQVSWCDGCFGQGSSPRYIGVQDRLGNPPALYLQIGHLELRGIKKRNTH